MKTNQFFKIFIPMVALFVAFVFFGAFFQPESVEAVSSETPQAVNPLFIDSNNQLIKNQRQVTFVGTRSGEGYFSTDGQWMVFQSERTDQNPFYQIYLMSLKTGDVKKISPSVGKTTCAWIHPTNKKILFSSTHTDPEIQKKIKEELEKRKNPVHQKYSWGFDEYYDIYESDFQGKNLKKLTQSLGYDAEASYSPNGQWIAFASNRKGYETTLSADEDKKFKQDPSYMMDIYIMKSDGSQVKQLTSEKGYDGGPFFSPDGQRITWRRFAPEGDRAEVYTMKIDGTDVKKITDLKSMSWAPFYHPSGDYIVFASSVLGYSNFELFIVDAEGLKKPVRVTQDEGFDGLPVFTPDGKKIFWSRSLDKQVSQIYMADWNDVSARKLLQLPPQLNSEDLNSTISSDDIRKEIEYLASPHFEGRRTGSNEEKIYTSQMESLFKKWGLKPYDGAYLKSFSFTSGAHLGPKNEIFIKSGEGATNETLLKPLEDYVPLSFSRAGKIDPVSVVFVGYGIKAPAKGAIHAYDSYKDVDVQGKWVLILNDMPQDVPLETRLHLTTYSRSQHKITVAKNEGAIGVLFVTGPLTPGKEDFSKLRYEGASPNSDVAVLKIKRSFIEKIFNESKKNLEREQQQLDKGIQSSGLEFKNIKITGTIDLEFIKSQGVNVVGYVDSQNAQGTLMIGAHGDHLGRGEVGNSLAKNSEVGQVHHGADDNASGVAGILELAHHYSEIQKKSPEKIRKRVFFSVWSGEELGNLGSSYFIKDNPKLKVDAYINMDMIGRYRQNIFIQGLGSGEGWRELLEKIALKSPLAISGESDPYLPTDSMSFYMAGVPSISFFTGSHGEYHSPRDMPDLINYEKTAEVVSLVKELADEVIRSPQNSIRYKKISAENRKLQGRGFRIYLGTVPDYTQEGVRGVRISGTSEGSPAHKAGLKEKDIIVEFNKLKIENMYDLVYALQAAIPNRPTTIKVIRNDKTEELNITPALKE